MSAAATGRHRAIPGHHWRQYYTGQTRANSATINGRLVNLDYIGINNDVDCC